MNEKFFRIEEIEDIGKVREIINTLDSLKKNSFEILPGLFDELKKIKKEYKEAKQIGNKAKLDKIIDSHVRDFIQGGYYFLNNLLQYSDVVNSIPKDELDSLVQKKEFLESLVLNDNNWFKFSQKLKKGDYTEF